MVENMLRDFRSAYGIRSVCLRYFNASGADPGGVVGENHDPESRVIPLVIEAALGQRGFLEVFGTDDETRGGTAIRDYVHVSDLASAHVLALRYLLNGGQSAALDSGTGRGHSVKEVIASVGPVRACEGRPAAPWGSLDPDC